MLRRALPLLLVACASLLAACGGSDDAPPQVTFTVAGQTRTTGPTQWCDIKVTGCSGDPAAEVHLGVAPGVTVDVAVPEPVSTAPWQVVFSYRTADGQQVDGRSPVFAANARKDYSLVLPAPTDQLITAQVQQYGIPTADPDTGQGEFPIRGSWVLVTDA
ncbi:DUF2771 family protein [Pseudonocardia dioxanivorans]|uniref:DUF2771 family protein n=1 Tax=Pseudonocardia dioxanivorans TaxID=240495 RepID=UPI000CCFDE84|nr:DUF2771 family protein [Pseudonocardia dioxanivorans]